MHLSQRASSLKASATVAVMNRAKQLKAQGVDVLNFSAGEPDFNSPEPAKKAGIEAIAANATKYIETAGDLGSRQLLATIITEHNKIPHVTPEHVIITAGVKMGLYLTMQCLFDETGPKQDLLLPVPAWVSFAPIAQLAGARIVELPTSTETGFKITPEQLKRAITPASRVLLLNTPSNPCSTMYSHGELAALADVIAQAAQSVAPELVVVADELYQHIVFGSEPHVSIGSFANVAERVITVNGPGKSFAMTGWRLGWASGSGDFGKQIIGAMTKLQGQTSTCVPAFSLAGMRAALTQCDAELATMRAAFAQRAELIYSLLSRVPGVKVARPVGAFYIFPDISAHLGKTTPSGKKINASADLCAALLDEQRVAVVPGEDFGSMGKNFFRMSFSCGEDQIREGVKRIAAMLGSLK